MNSRGLFTSALSSLVNGNRDPGIVEEKFAVRVKELSERDRRRLLMHLLALDDDDRLLRFGTVLPDLLITKYVQMLNFARDTVFGVYDNKFKLVGFGHLAFAPREALPQVSDATIKERVAEFGPFAQLLWHDTGLATEAKKLVLLPLDVYPVMLEPELVAASAEPTARNEAETVADLRDLATRLPGLTEVAESADILGNAVEEAVCPEGNAL